MALTALPEFFAIVLRLDKQGNEALQHPDVRRQPRPVLVMPSAARELHSG